MDWNRQIGGADRLFEGKEAVLHVMGWVGRCARRDRFVDSRLLGRIEGPTLNLRVGSS